MNIVFLSLGSNIGDRKKNLLKAISLLEDKIKIIKISSIYKTEPVDYINQNYFFNLVIKARTKLNAFELLVFIKDIEKKMKRKNTIKKGPRIIDIDILLYNNIIVKTEKLQIPHKEIFKRNFVIKPLSEIQSKIKIGNKIIYLKKYLKKLQMQKVEQIV